MLQQLTFAYRELFFQETCPKLRVRTTPREVREALGVKEGDRVEFFLDRTGRLSLFARNRPISGIFGLGAGAATLTDEERMTWIADEIAARGRSKEAEQAA